MLIPYTRLSPEHQEREREGCDIQLSRIRSYCEAHALECGEEIRDQDVSGKSLQRTGWARAMALLEVGEASGLIVYRLDRLTRRLRDLLEVMELFRVRGWQLHAVADKIDTTSATGRLIVHILGSISEWERDTTRERTSAALRHKIRQGLHIGGVPYGWRRAVGPDGKLTALLPEEQEQRGLHYARACEREGLTQDQIAQALTKAGYLARSGRPWSRRGVQCILSQPSIDGSMDEAESGPEA